MKALARSFVWWPDIDLDIEDKVRLCHVCTKAHHAPYYCGLGRLNLGKEFMLIMLRSRVNNFFLWLTATLNGWKSFL